MACISLPAMPPAPPPSPVTVPAPPPPAPPPAPAPGAPAPAPLPSGVPQVVVDLGQSFIKTIYDCVRPTPMLPAILAAGGITAGRIAEVDILLTNLNTDAAGSINVALRADTGNATTNAAEVGGLSLNEVAVIPVPAGASNYVSWIVVGLEAGTAVMTLDTGTSTVVFNIVFTDDQPC